MTGTDSHKIGMHRICAHSSLASEHSHQVFCLGLNLYYPSWTWL